MICQHDGLKKYVFYNYLTSNALYIEGDPVIFV